MQKSTLGKAAGGGREALQNTLAAFAIVLLAGVIADIVLWPRDQLPPVANVSEHRYFTQAFIDHAQAFRGAQSWLGIGSLLALVLAPLTVALVWPRGNFKPPWGALTDRRSGAAFGRGGAFGCAVVGAGVTVFALTAALPFDLAAFLRARNYGLAVQSTSGWFGDWLLGLLLAAVGVALLAALAGFFIRVARRAWWIPFAASLVILAFVFQALSPVLIAPLFGHYTRVPEGALLNEVDSIAAQSGVRAGDVFTVDAARRTTGANAFVSGLGGTKRVVIYDTLLKDFTPAERKQVLAHEFGHAKHRDLLAGLIWFAFVATVSLFAVDLFARVLANRRGVELSSPAGIAMVAAAVMLAAALSQPAANAYSRRVEARADAFALRVTQQPAAGIALERRLTITNLARPVPPAALQWLLGTHPTPMQRIGMAETVRRELAAGKVEAAP